MVLEIRWYWEHVKSAYSFGGYKHPTTIRYFGREYWLAVFRSVKSLIIIQYVLAVVLAVLLGLLYAIGI